jgi:hypothetical protein
LWSHEQTERIGKHTWPKTLIYLTPTGKSERDKKKLVKWREERN